MGQLCELISVQRECSLAEATGVSHLQQKLQKAVILKCFASSQNISYSIVVTSRLHIGNSCNSTCEERSQTAYVKGLIRICSLHQ